MSDEILKNVKQIKIYIKNEAFDSPLSISGRFYEIGERIRYDKRKRR
jgi:hypothetical protein